jgi:hypothetical protein
LLDGYHSPFAKIGVTETNLESAMFLTAKIHVVSGMMIGALAVMAAKQMCKQRRKRQRIPEPISSSTQQ